MNDVGALVVGGDYRGLWIVRSLGRRGVPVWVAQGGDMLAGCSRYARQRLHWPTGTEGEQTEFLERLANQRGLDGWVLFPTADETAWMISRNHAALSAHYRLTTSPWSEHVVAADKRLAYGRAEALGIDVPRTWYPESAAELAELPLEFPVILKPALRITHNSFTDDKAWLIEDRGRLLGRYESACRLLPSQYVMIQEVIGGGGEHQLAFGAACQDGEVLAFVTAQRSRQYPLDFGRASTFVETIERPDIVESSRRLLADLRLSGLVEVEYKHDPRDGRFKLLDVNARSWGWHSIGSAAGVDFAYVAWRVARGESVTRTQGRPGVRWVRLAIDLPISAREIAASRLPLGPYVRSLRPPIEGPISAFDDPLPWLMDLPLLARRTARRFRFQRATRFGGTGDGHTRPEVLRHRSRRVVGVARAVARNPYEARQRVFERIAEWNDGHGRRVQPSIVRGWEEHFHGLLGERWPCRAHDEFAALYDDVTTSLAERGLPVGRGVYGGWDDGDAALARAVWCATLHTRPEHVVETGVARGITSRVVLEALERSGFGNLWSIDIPPLIETGLRAETAVAVPEHLRRRWRYVEGSSRRRLPTLVSVLGRVDLFIHDSMHTTRNVAFELAQVWPALRDGGVAVVDDVERNSAFAAFGRARTDWRAVAGMADDDRAVVGVAIKGARASGGGRVH